MRRGAAAVALLIAVAGCGSSGSPNTSAPSPGTSSGPCTPSGTGTTDLTKKPTVKRPTAPAPTETTTFDIVCGTGAQAAVGSKAVIKYVGLLYKDGVEFGSTWKVGTTTSVKIGSGTIPGFTKGLTGMKVGGRREIIIPSKDAFGDTANGPIPAGATIIFVVDLVSITPPPARTPCTPSGTGSTDLSKKPVVTVPKGPPPTETKVIDIVCGTGAQADDGSAVSVQYVGVLYANGKEFDASWKTGTPFGFTVGTGVVNGFSIGVTGMKVGGRREVIIPSKDGYGVSGSPPTIPGGATLVFVIDLVKVS